MYKAMFVPGKNQAWRRTSPSRRVPDYPNGGKRLPEYVRSMGGPANLIMKNSYQMKIDYRGRVPTFRQKVESGDAIPNILARIAH
jgi:hypothetical protein